MASTAADSNPTPIEEKPKTPTSTNPNPEASTQSRWSSQLHELLHDTRFDANEIRRVRQKLAIIRRQQTQQEIVRLQLANTIAQLSASAHSLQIKLSSATLLPEEQTTLFEERQRVVTLLKARRSERDSLEAEWARGTIELTFTDRQVIEFAKQQKRLVQEAAQQLGMDVEYRDDGTFRLSLLPKRIGGGYDCKGVAQPAGDSAQGARPGVDKGRRRTRTPSRISATSSRGSSNPQKGSTSNQGPSNEPFESNIKAPNLETYFGRRIRVLRGQMALEKVKMKAATDGQDEVKQRLAKAKRYGAETARMLLEESPAKKSTKSATSQPPSEKPKSRRIIPSSTPALEQAALVSETPISSGVCGVRAQATEPPTSATLPAISTSSASAVDQSDLLALVEISSILPDPSPLDIPSRGAATLDEQEKDAEYSRMLEQTVALTSVAVDISLMVDLALIEQYSQVDCGPNAQSNRSPFNNPALSQALKEEEDERSQISSRTVRQLNELALKMAANGKLEMAHKLLARALLFTEGDQAHCLFPSKKTRLALSSVTSNNLGWLLQRKGQTAQAARYLRQAVVIDSFLGKPAPSLLINFSAALTATHRFSEAVQTCKRAIRTLNDELLNVLSQPGDGGELDPAEVRDVNAAALSRQRFLAVAWHNLAMAQKQCNDSPDRYRAFTSFRCALSIAACWLGDSHPTTLSIRQSGHLHGLSQLNNGSSRAEESLLLD